ncbi:MAG: type II toxin-antitoxin system prevent-host-death family antitoxin [Trueperaceae bacterium]
MRVTNISEAKANLSKLVERAIRGEEVVIGKAGKPVAKLVPFDVDNQPRDLDQGIWEGEVRIAEDFDELPDEFLQLFTGVEEREPLT